MVCTHVTPPRGMGRVEGEGVHKSPLRKGSGIYSGVYTHTTFHRGEWHINCHSSSGKMVCTFHPSARGSSVHKFHFPAGGVAGGVVCTHATPTQGEWCVHMSPLHKGSGVYTCHPYTRGVVCTHVTPK